MTDDTIGAGGASTTEPSAASTTPEADPRTTEGGASDAEAVYAALNELSKDPPGAKKEDQAAEQTPEKKDDKDKKGEPKAPEKQPDKKAEGEAGGGDDEDLFAVPVLDPELEKFPEAKKRFEEQTAGLKKLYDREKDLLPKIEHMAGYVEGLSRAETAPKTVREILDLTAANIGLKVPELLAQAGYAPSGQAGGAAAGAAGPTKGAQGAQGGQIGELFAEHKDKFLDDGEYEFANLMGGLILDQIGKALDQRIGPVQALAEKSQQEEAKARLAQQFDKAVVDALPGVSGHFGKVYGGFSVTKEMLAEAMEAFPQAEPIQAVQTKFSKEIIEHGLKGARRDGTMAPEGIGGDDNRGVKALDPDEDIDAALVYHALQGR